MAGLEVEDVTVSFGDRVILDGVSLGVERGDVVALLGPSGSGKSTLLRVIAGLWIPDAGRVSWNGRDITGVRTHERGFGFVFQDDQLFPHRNVAANIGFGLRMAGRPRPEIAARVEEMLALVDLQGFGPRSVTTLSGGEAKRVALARALAPAPRLLLLDEPLTGLDADLHDRLAVDLRHVLRATGVTAILVTHDIAEATAVAHRVVRLSELSTPQVVTLAPGETYDLRRRVLRAGTPSTAVAYTQDDQPDTVHLGLTLSGVLVGVSTWAPEPWPGAPSLPAIRLRGMAIEPALQNRRLGEQLLLHGLERAWSEGAQIVWASARDTALRFYQRLGFTVEGNGFVDGTTGLGHHGVWIRRPA